MNGLLKGEPLARQVSFVKQGILKPNDYKQRRTKYQALGLVPGDGLFKPGLMREFSLSQFTFNTMDQFVKWEKEITKRKNKFGQSLERFFIAPDGTLDFGSMVETVDKLIREGNDTPLETLDPTLTKPSVVMIEHPELGTFISMRALLGLARDDDD